MREKLVDYVELLFAGAAWDERTAEIKAEILQNTLDKFDDLVAEGKSPEAAYSLAVAGIGDVGEILGGGQQAAPGEASPELRQKREKTRRKRSTMRAVAIALYICSVVPPILMSNSRLEETLAPALMFAFIAVATAMMVMQAGMRVPGSQPEPNQQEPNQQERSWNDPQRERRRAVTGALWVVGVSAYFIVSFCTGAWHLTWLIFPVTAAATGLVKAIVDLREVEK